jgi:hypothetical protein
LTDARAPIERYLDLVDADARRQLVRGLAFAGAGVVAGCVTVSDQGGHSLAGLNDSEHDVVIELSAASPRSFVLPSHAYAELSTGHEDVGANWDVKVLGSKCDLIADKRITQAHGVLYIGEGRRVEWHMDATASASYVTISSPAPTTCPSS